MAGGRPTDYDKTIINKTLLYIDSCKDEQTEFHTKRSDGSNSYEYKVRVNIPTVEGLALHLGVSRSTVYKWREDHPEFSDIIDQLLTKQADMLLRGGLSGDYNSTISKVILTKHGYREGQEITGEGGKPLSGLSDEEKEKLLGLIQTKP